MAVLIEQNQAYSIIDKREPLGTFYYQTEDNMWVAIDNRTGDAWTEEFTTKEQCLAWLNDEFEMSELDEHIAIREEDNIDDDPQTLKVSPFEVYFKEMILHYAETHKLKLTKDELKEAIMILYHDEHLDNEVTETIRFALDKIKAG